MTHDFPHEEEPDGDRWLAHHFLIGIGMMLVGWAQWTATGTPEIAVYVIALGFFVALDDLVSHAFGVWTPLDAGFTLFIRWYQNR